MKRILNKIVKEGYPALSIVTENYAYALYSGNRKVIEYEIADLPMQKMIAV